MRRQLMRLLCLCDICASKIFAHLPDNIAPSVFYTGACMIQIESHVGIKKLNVLTGPLVNVLLKKIR
jgi:hypothetical protein